MDALLPAAYALTLLLLGGAAWRLRASLKSAETELALGRAGAATGMHEGRGERDEVGTDKPS